MNYFLFQFLPDSPFICFSGLKIEEGKTISIFFRNFAAYEIVLVDNWKLFIEYSILDIS